MVRGSTPSRTSASRIGTSTVPGVPAGPRITRPWMPIFMVMLPALTAHSRAVWETVAWKRRLVALGSAPGVFTARVAAPERTVTPGHSRLGSGPAGAVAATFSWPDAFPDENRFLTRWVKDEPPPESGGEDDPMVSKEEQPEAARMAMSPAARAARNIRPGCWPYLVKRFFPSWRPLIAAQAWRTKGGDMELPPQGVPEPGVKQMV